MNLHALPQNLQRGRYYVTRIPAAFLPRVCWTKGLDQLLTLASDEDMLDRIQYYHPQNHPFTPGDDARPFHVKLTGKQSTYQLDLYEVLKYFPPVVRVHRIFGDNILNPETPAIVKTRPISETPGNGILLKLNQVRHFMLVKDPVPYRKKRDVLVWRGNAWQPHRKAFLSKFHNHPRCDAGHYHKRPSPETAWNKNPLSIHDQLKYKFILSLEGNDVATSLKWILFSKSLCFMPKPRYESWLMEGRLRAGVHYVELADDFSDLDEKLDHYLSNPGEAEEIIRNANLWMAPFRDTRREHRIGVQVMAKYLRLSGQI